MTDYGQGDNTLLKWGAYLFYLSKIGKITNLKYLIDHPLCSFSIIIVTL